MKIQFTGLLRCNSERAVTTFGRARLIARTRHAVELCGGESHERTDAKEWMSLFMHEAVLTAPRQRRQRSCR